MATSGSCTDAYSGRTSFNGYLSVYRYAVSGTSARWGWELRARNPNGNSQTYMLDNKAGTVVVAGQSFPVSHSLDFRGGQSYIVLGSGVTGWINQGSGTPTISFSFSHGPAGVFGTASGSGSFSADSLATVPPAPKPLSVSNVTQTTARYQFQSQGQGAGTFLRWEAQWSTSATFATGNSPILTSSGTSDFTGLPPGTKVYFRSRGVNSYGAGAWSSIINATTLPSGARVGSGGGFPIAATAIGAGGAFPPTQILIGSGGTFRPPA